ncbi:unnamed protein product, partial [Ectocarpus sp. 12 AP-2014]
MERLSFSIVEIFALSLELLLAVPCTPEVLCFVAASVSPCPRTNSGRGCNCLARVIMAGLPSCHVVSRAPPKKSTTGEGEEELSWTPPHTHHPSGSPPSSRTRLTGRRR